MPEVEFFDMMDSGPGSDRSELEPRVESSGNAMLEDDVDSDGPLPDVTCDDRAL